MNPVRIRRSFSSHYNYNFFYLRKRFAELRKSQLSSRSGSTGRRAQFKFSAQRGRRFVRRNNKRTGRGLQPFEPRASRFRQRRTEILRGSGRYLDGSGRQHGTSYQFGFKQKGMQQSVRD